MVHLKDIKESVVRASTALPPGLVAVFVGSTSGVGEASMKQFAKWTMQPRIYFIGRSTEAADRLTQELKSLNAGGTYIFIQADTSLLRNVDKVCADIKAKETAINLLFLSTGTLVTGTKTTEDLHLFAALAYYSRTRFILNLLPLVKAATSLRRVVSIFAGTKEGPMFTNDFPGFHISMVAGRGHFASMQTLTLEMIARDAPEVSFLHVYPGFVKSNLARDINGIFAAIGKFIFAFISIFLNIPFEEVGERQTFLSTSARFPPAANSHSAAAGVPLSSNLTIATGSNGKVGSGVYTVDYEGETPGSKIQKTLADMRSNKSQEKLWGHLKAEFERCTGSISIP